MIAAEPAACPARPPRWRRFRIAVPIRMTLSRCGAVQLGALSDGERGAELPNGVHIRRAPGRRARDGPSCTAGGAPDPKSLPTPAHERRRPSSATTRACRVVTVGDACGGLICPPAEGFGRLRAACRACQPLRLIHLQGMASRCRQAAVMRAGSSRLVISRAAGTFSRPGRWCGASSVAHRGLCAPVVTGACHHSWSSACCQIGRRRRSTSARHGPRGCPRCGPRLGVARCRPRGAPPSGPLPCRWPGSGTWAWDSPLLSPRRTVANAEGPLPWTNGPPPVR